MPRQYPDHRQDTPLHAAAANGNAAVIVFFVPSIAQFLNISLHKSFSTLDRYEYDCKRVRNLRHEISVGTALSNGHYFENTKHAQSLHPRNVQCIKLLLEFAASPRPRNMVGLTAYDLAVAAQQSECAALLEKVEGGAVWVQVVALTPVPPLIPRAVHRVPRRRRCARASRMDRRDIRRRAGHESTRTRGRR